MEKNILTKPMLVAGVGAAVDVQTISSRVWGEMTKYKFISPKTSERHIKEFELPSDAYYWGMMNLDLSMDWEVVLI